MHRQSASSAKAHCFGTLNWEVDEEGELIIWGYDAFEIYENS